MHTHRKPKWRITAVSHLVLGWPGKSESHSSNSNIPEDYPKAKQHLTYAGSLTEKKIYPKESWKWREARTALACSPPRDSEYIPYQTWTAHFKLLSDQHLKITGSTFVSPCLHGVGKPKSWSIERGSSLEDWGCITGPLLVTSAPTTIKEKQVTLVSKKYEEFSLWSENSIHSWAGS